MINIPQFDIFTHYLVIQGDSSFKILYIMSSDLHWFDQIGRISIYTSVDIGVNSALARFVLFYRSLSSVRIPPEQLEQIIIHLRHTRLAVREVDWMRRIFSDPILKYSNHSAGIFSFVDARGKDKRSSMRGYQLTAGPRAFSRSGKRGTAHHRGLVSLRISDGKFVNHTTEMILWSMILTLPCLACPCDQPRIST